MSVSLLYKSIYIYIYLIYTIKLQVKNKLQATFYTNIHKADFYSFSGGRHLCYLGLYKKNPPSGALQL